MKLTIIIPVFNEEVTISEIIKRVKKVMLPRGVIKEIIVVDDASTDTTGLILSKVKGVNIYRHKKNLGKGAAISTGLIKSKGDIILIQDADLEYNPKDYPRLIEPILNKKTKIVYGSRLKNYPLRVVGQKRTPLISHFLGNKFLSFFTNILYGNSLSDMETGYKVFHKSALTGINLKAKRFDFEPEITAKVLKKGYEIYEVPIKVRPRGYEEGKKISWKDGFIALWTLFKYRLID